jgi:hypothetical protein
MLANRGRALPGSEPMSHSDPSRSFADLGGAAGMPGSVVVTTTRGRADTTAVANFAGLPEAQRNKSRHESFAFQCERRPGARGRSAVDSATVVIIVAAAISAAVWQLFSLSNNPGRAGCANNMERNAPPSRRSAIAGRLEPRRGEMRAGNPTIPQLSASESDLRRARLAELVAPASPAPTSTAPTSSEPRTFREEAVRDARGVEDEDTRSGTSRDVRERLDGAAPLT